MYIAKIQWEKMGGRVGIKGDTESARLTLINDYSKHTHPQHSTVQFSVLCVSIFTTTRSLQLVRCSAVHWLFC